MQREGGGQVWMYMNEMEMKVTSHAITGDALSCESVCVAWRQRV